MHRLLPVHITYQYKNEKGALSMYKIKNNFSCQEVLGDYMVIPQGEAMQTFSGTLILSETSAFAWKLLQAGCTKEALIDAMLEEYDADRDVIAADMDALIDQLQSYDVLEVCE